MKAISCRSISIHYTKQTVLNAVSLDVETGSCFGLVGENGAGKSTLIKSMLDLVAMDGGECVLFGSSSRQVSAREHLAYLPDRFVPPYYLKAGDFLKYVGELQGQRFTDEQVQQVLQSFDLHASALQKSVRELSKGMTQKLGLAACFLSNKDLYILDEPMSGLDPKARVLVKQQIKQRNQSGATIFFSSHMLADVEELADHMAVLHRGELRFSGPVAEFKQRFEAATMEQAYLNCIGNEENEMS